MRAFIRACEADRDAGGAFDPETISILVTAFEDAWQSVKTSGVTLTTDKRIQTMRESLAKMIIELAEQGERNPHQLRKAALLSLVHFNRRYAAPGTRQIENCGTIEGRGHDFG